MPLSFCYCHRPTVNTIIQLLSPFWSSTGQEIQLIIVYPPLPINNLKFHRHWQILRFQEIPCPKSHKSPTKMICSEVFFWVCFGFLRFSFAITVLSCFVPQARVFISLLRFRSIHPIFCLLRFRLFHQVFSFVFFLSFHKSDFVLLLYQITYIVSEYVYF